jgi:hypothetical protein
MWINIVSCGRSVTVIVTATVTAMALPWLAMAVTGAAGPSSYKQVPVAVFHPKIMAHPHGPGEH